MAKNKEQKNTKITTIKVNHETKERLDHLKEFKRESYDEILRKTLFILNNLRANPSAAQGILRNIDSKAKRKHQVYSGIPEENPAEAEEIPRKIIKQESSKIIPEKNSRQVQNLVRKISLNKK